MSGRQGQQGSCNNSYEAYMLGSSYGVGKSASSIGMGGPYNNGQGNVRDCMLWPGNTYPSGNAAKLGGECGHWSNGYGGGLGGQDSAFNAPSPLSGSQMNGNFQQQQPPQSFNIPSPSSGGQMNGNFQQEQQPQSFNIPSPSSGGQMNGNFQQEQQPQSFNTPSPSSGGQMNGNFQYQQQQQRQSLKPQSFSSGGQRTRNPQNQQQARAFVRASGNCQGEEARPMSIPCQVAPLGTNPYSLIKPMEPVTLNVTAPYPQTNEHGVRGPMTFRISPQDLYRSRK